uniref:Bm13549 n=1 Tax=Brugia malayi TaxID=6279 RepID=A0A0J9Y1K1_BRUMA|nr:Bm13549 [Brugia malayi]
MSQKKFSGKTKCKEQCVRKTSMKITQEHYSWLISA